MSAIDASIRSQSSTAPMAARGRVLRDLALGNRKGVDLRHELRLNALFAWDYAFANAMLRVLPARKRARTDRVRGAEYRDDSPVPRCRYRLREHLDRDGLVVQKIAMSLILPTQLKVARYLFLDDLPLHGLVREFLGITDLEACYADRIVVDQLLNGFWPLPFVPDESGVAGHVSWERRFDDCEIDGLGDLPGLRIDLDVRGSAPALRRIVFYPRQDGLGAPAQLQTHTPEDGATWLLAKKSALSVLHYIGTIEHHAAFGHLNAEQYLIALLRTLSPSNPLYALLHPHLKGCHAINRISVDRIFFGPQPLHARAGPLTTPALHRLLTHALGQCDWKGWQPHASLGSFHVYANAANTYWSILTEYVDRYFALHANALTVHAVENEAFCKELSGHSVRRGEGVPAVSPLEGTSFAQRTQELKQLCRYVIHLVTFEHARLHDLQAMPYLYASTVQRDPEEHERIRGSYEWRKSALKALSVDRLFRLASEFMHRYQFRSLLRNHDGDVPELFLRIVARRQPELQAAGYDPGLLLQLLL